MNENKIKYNTIKQHEDCEMKIRYVFPKQI